MPRLATSHRRFRSLPRWMILLLVATLLRALTFGNPIIHIDEEFYFATAHAMAQGAIPYVDVWDRKPVGLFLLYLPAAALGMPLGIWAYQLLALASVTATAALIARLADRAGWIRGALPGAIVYLVWLDLLDGQGGQTPIFYNLLMVAAVNLIAPRPDDAGHAGRRFGYGCAALALVGLALQIKYAVVFEGLAFGLWWVWREWRLGRRWWRAVVLGLPLAALAAAPSLAAWGWFSAHRLGDAYVYANFQSIGQRQPDPALEQLGNLAVMALILSPLVAMATLAALLPRASEPALGMRRWLFGWAGVATLAMLVFGTYFDHYGLPLLAPLSACAAGFFAEHRRAARTTLPLLLILSCGALGIVIGKLHVRGTPAQFAAIVRTIGRGPGCLYVYSGSPQYYPYSGRCSLTRYRFPSHLGQSRERGAIGVDQAAEVERIMAARPEIVVLGAPYRGERPEIRALFLRLVAAQYRQRAVLPLGSKRIAVYALR